MIAALLPILGTVLDKVIPDANARAEAKEKMEKELVSNSNALNLAIMEINKADAQSSNLFQSTWRPAIGWTCAIGFFYTFVGYPIIGAVLVANGVETPMPELNTDILMEMTLAMLGLGGLRSWEKLKGLTK